MLKSRPKHQSLFEPLEHRRLLSTTIYACDTAENLLTIDSATGQTHVVGNMGDDMYDIAENTNGELFGIDSLGTLCSIDSTTGVATTIVQTFGGFNGLTFSSNGTLYGAHTNLSIINPSNGNSTYVCGLIGSVCAGDLAFDGEGNLFLTTTLNQLAKINLQNGTVTNIGPIGFSNVYGMDFGADGVMYGLTDSDQIISINLDTGKGTLISTLTGISTLQGATTLPEAPLPPAPINVQASDGKFANRIKISWSTVQNAISYEVWRYTINEPQSATLVASNIHTSVYSDVHIMPGTRYYYWIKAEFDNGISAFSKPDLGDTHPPAESLLYDSAVAWAKKHPKPSVKSLTDFIGAHEGRVLYVYPDSSHIPTIGYGFNLATSGAQSTIDKVLGKGTYAVLMASFSATKLAWKKDFRKNASSDPTFYYGSTNWNIFYQNHVSDVLVHRITAVNATALLSSILPSYQSAAKSLLPAGLFSTLSAAAQIALTDIVYNRGAGNVKTYMQPMLNDLVAGDYAMAAWDLMNSETSTTIWAAVVGDRSKDDLEYLAWGHESSLVRYLT